MMVKVKDALMNALNFSHEELEMNRRGVFSEAQINRLRESRTTALKGILVIAPICIGLVGYWARYLPSVEGVLAVLIFGSLGGIMLFTGLSEAVNAHEDLKKKSVQIVEGGISFNLQATNSYTLNVAGKSFVITKEACAILKEHEAYRIYYTPNTKRILSAEWLR